MKKMKNIIIILMLLISISSLALAEEVENTEEPEIDESQNDGNETEDPELNETDDLEESETEEEIEIMNDNLGSEIRLLQLEKAITKNLLKGEMTVNVLQGLNYNTTDLEVILDEFKLVLEEVKAADPNASDAVQIFVDLKSDARNLTKQFRETVKDLLSDIKYKEIKEQMKNITNGELEKYTKNIQRKIKQFNRNQIHKLYGLIGDGNNSFVNQYMNGTISQYQLKMQISKMVNHKMKDKMQIYKNIKAEKIQCKDNASKKFENITNNFELRQQERLQRRLENANNTGNEKLMEKIQNMIENNKNKQGKNKGSNGNNPLYGNGKGTGK